MILQIENILIFLRESTIYFAIYSIYVISLNLEAGQLGLPQFGKIMFWALGAIAVGGIAVKLALWMYQFQILAQLNVDPFKDFYDFCYQYQFRAIGIINNIFSSNPHVAIGFFLLSVILAIGLSALLGVAFAGPALRLREDYLGILLLVSSQLVTVISTYTTPIACGTFGAAVPDPFAWAGQWKPYVFLVVAMAFLGIALLVAERLVRSPFGRSMRAIRDAEVAARAFGKDLVSYRAKVLAVASAMAGVAGALDTFYSSYLSTNSFVPFRTFVAWAMLVVGGIGNNLGALVGVLVYRGLDSLLSIFKGDISSLLAGVDPTYLQYLIFGILIIFILMYMPRGLVPEKPSTALSRRELEELRARSATSPPSSDREAGG